MTNLSALGPLLMPPPDDDPVKSSTPVVLGTPLASSSAVVGDAAPSLERRRRFNGVERALHWSAAGLFLLLLATGLALFHPQWRNWDIGGIKVVKETHLTLAVLLPLLPLTFAAWDGGQALRHNLAALWRWQSTDWRWLAALGLTLLGQRPHWPAVGRYNAGQKLNSLYLAGLTLGLIISGSLIWPDRLLEPALRASLYALHDLLMLLSLPVLLLHLSLALLWPTTRPALGGMLSGDVPATWHAQHYPLDPGPPAAPPTPAPATVNLSQTSPVDE
jgi:formate dehydrogenase subunit gamma